MQAFDYVYQHYFHKADFFMKADDDTYVLIENLRYFLSYLDRDKPFVTGRHFKNKEDVELSRCLEKLGVGILNSTDARGGSRFHAYTPMHHVVRGLGKNYQYWDANIVRTGPEAINEYPITFHYIKPADMKLLHFFFYRVYGIKYQYI